MSARRIVEIAAVAERWKIQMLSPRGWADVKASEDGQAYSDDHYDSKEEAEAELREFPDFGDGEYRVVPASTPADDDMYS